MEGPGSITLLKQRSKKMKNTTKVLMGIFAVLFVAACGGTKEVKPTVLGNGCPVWTMQGTGAFNDGNLYGVGMYKGSSNKAMAYTMADTRARVNIARSLQSKVDDLVKDYQASTQAGDNSSDEQDSTIISKIFSQQNLTGTIVKEHCDGTDGYTYSLVMLDLNTVNKMIEEQKQLSPRVKAMVKENAAKAFEDLNAEAAK